MARVKRISPNMEVYFINILLVKFPIHIRVLAIKLLSLKLQRIVV